MNTWFRLLKQIQRFLDPMEAMSFDHAPSTKWFSIGSEINAGGLFLFADGNQKPIENWSRSG